MERCPEEEVGLGPANEDEAVQAESLELATEAPPLLDALQVQRAVLAAEWFWYEGDPPACWEHAPYASRDYRRGH